MWDVRPNHRAGSSISRMRPPYYSVSAMRPPYYPFLEEIDIVGVIYGRRGGGGRQGKRASEHSNDERHAAALLYTRYMTSPRACVLQSPRQPHSFRQNL